MATKHAVAGGGKLSWHFACFALPLSIEKIITTQKKGIIVLNSNWLRLAFACVTVLALNACKVETPDGKIPEDYVPQAQKMSGTYRGQMDGGQAGALVFRMNGATPVLKMTGGRLLGAECSSDIGQLLSVEANGSSVSSATFALSGASCVEGNTIEVSVSDDFRTLNVSVLAESHEVTTCPSQTQIWDCQRRAERDSDRCEREENSSMREMCRRDADRSYGSCGDCSTSTVSTHIYGTFSR